MTLHFTQIFFTDALTFIRDALPSAHQMFARVLKTYLYR
jgi:hypothetical protein